MQYKSLDPLSQIKKHLEAVVELPQEDWSFFVSKMKTRFYPKKSLLLEKGEVENMLCYIEKGAIRYFVPKSANEGVTFGFRHEDEFSSAYDSLISRRPSYYSLEAMDDCMLWCITYDDLQDIYANTRSGNVIGRLFAEANLIEKWRRELSFLDKTAEERYLDIFNRRPQLFQQVPLKYLASYIGVTPQALSRIRKRIS